MVGPTEGVILLLFFGLLAAVVFGVIDVLRCPRASWQAAGRSRGLTLVLVLFLPLVGLPYHFLGNSPRRAH